jgi:aryl-alcohol dehydrogenase
VVVSFDSCGSCANCLAAHPAYCDTFVPRNLSGVGLDGSSPVRDGSGEPVAARWFGQSSFATHTVVAARNVVKVDQDLPLELLGPLGCGVQTGVESVLLALRVTAGSSLVVFGAGGVGLSAIMAARLAGAATIAAVDLNLNRLELARKLGATHVFDGRQQDLLAALQGVTGGGAQYTLDTTGVPGVITAAIHLLRPTGTCGLVGVLWETAALDQTVLFGRNIMGIMEGDAVPRIFIPWLIELWRQSRFPFDKLIKTFPLEQINEAEQAAIKGEVVKPVLVPAGW